MLSRRKKKGKINKSQYVTEEDYEGTYFDEVKNQAIFTGLILKYIKVLCGDVPNLAILATAAYMKTTPNKFGRMGCYWGSESFFRILEAITMHRIFFIQEN